MSNVVFKAALLTALASMLQALMVRMLSYVFPFQMVFAISLTAAFSILFTGLGALLSRRVARYEGPALAACGGLYALSFVAVSLGTLLPKSALFAVTIENILAALPSGTLATVVFAGFAVAGPLLLSGALLGQYYERVLESERHNLRWLVAASALAFFAGYVGAAALITHTGIWNLVVAAAALVAALALRPARFAVAAVVILVGVAAFNPDRFLFARLGREPMTWVQGPGVKPLLGFWSPYARLDFYDLGDGRMGGLYNGIQWWSTGDTSRDIPLRRDLYRHVSGDVLVIGSGGGFGMLSLTRATDITAVELDPGVVAALRGPLAERAGGIYRRVHAVVGDGRSFLDATDRRFDYVIYEAPEFVFTSTEKSFVSMENHLYTVEGLARAVDRLKPDGTLIIVHTYGLIPTEKLIKGLPGEVHWASFRAVAEIVPRFEMVVLTVSRSERSLAPLRDALIALGAAETTRAPELVAAVEIAQAVTDNRPVLHFKGWRQALPVFVAALAFLITLLALVFLQSDRRQAAYFASIGVGFILAELAVINLLRSVLGGYIETTGVALGLLAAAMAAGAWFHERLGRLAITILTVAGFAILIGLLTHVPHAAPVAVKVAWMALAVTPVGFALGTYFPLGLLRGGAAKSSYYYAVDTVGSAFGFLLFYVLILAGGFLAAAACALVLYMAAGLLAGETPG